MRRKKLDELRQKRQEGYIAYFKGANIIVKSRAAIFKPGWDKTGKTTATTGSETTISPADPTTTRRTTRNRGRGGHN